MKDFVIALECCARCEIDVEVIYITGCLSIALIIVTIELSFGETLF